MRNRVPRSARVDRNPIHEPEGGKVVGIYESISRGLFGLRWYLACGLQFDESNDCQDGWFIGFVGFLFFLPLGIRSFRWQLKSGISLTFMLKSVFDLL